MLVDGQLPIRGVALSWSEPALVTLMYKANIPNRHHVMSLPPPMSVHLANRNALVDPDIMRSVYPPSPP